MQRIATGNENESKKCFILAKLKLTKDPYCKYAHIPHTQSYRPHQIKCTHIFVTKQQKLYARTICNPYSIVSVNSRVVSSMQMQMQMQTHLFLIFLSIIVFAVCFDLGSIIFKIVIIVVFLFVGADHRDFSKSIHVACMFLFVSIVYSSSLHSLLPAPGTHTHLPSHQPPMNCNLHV